MQESKAPWETPTVQNIISMFDGKVTAVESVNVVRTEVNDAEIQR